MKTTFLLILSLLIFQINYGQKTAKMIIEYGSKNHEINSLMTFQNIEVEKISFESPEIIGKHYEVNLKEYKKGKLVNTKNLFDTGVVDYLKIDSTYTSFKFFSKIDEDKLMVFVESSRMHTAKRTFNLEKRKGSAYALKDFLGIEGFTNVPLNEEFPILAIITPTKQEDGMSSYCEVAQSKVAPDQYWEKFEIPHYFVITVKFK